MFAIVDRTAVWAAGYRLRAETVCLLKSLNLNLIRIDRQLPAHPQRASRKPDDCARQHRDFGGRQIKHSCPEQDGCEQRRA